MRERCEGAADGATLGACDGEALSAYDGIVLGLVEGIGGGARRLTHGGGGGGGQMNLEYVTQESTLVVTETVNDVMWFYTHLSLERTVSNKDKRCVHVCCCCCAPSRCVVLGSWAYHSACEPCSLQGELRAGGRACPHTPSRVAPSVGRHQLNTARQLHLPTYFSMRA